MSKFVPSNESQLFGRTVKSIKKIWTNYRQQKAEGDINPLKDKPRLQRYSLADLMPVERTIVRHHA